MTNLKRIGMQVTAAGAVLAALLAAAWTVQPQVHAQAAGVPGQQQLAGMLSPTAIDYIAGQHLRVRQDAVRGLFLPNPMNGFDASVKGGVVKLADGCYDLDMGPLPEQTDSTPSWSLAWKTLLLGREGSAEQSRESFRKRPCHQGVFFRSSFSSGPSVSS